MVLERLLVLAGFNIVGTRLRWRWYGCPVIDVDVNDVDFRLIGLGCDDGGTVNNGWIVPSKVPFIN